MGRNEISVSDKVFFESHGILNASNSNFNWHSSLSIGPFNALKKGTHSQRVLIYGAVMKQEDRYGSAVMRQEDGVYTILIVTRDKKWSCHES